MAKSMKGGAIMDSVTMFFSQYWCHISAGLAVLFAILYFFKPTQVITPKKEKMCGSCPKNVQGLGSSMGTSLGF